MPGIPLNLNLNGTRKGTMNGASDDERNKALYREVLSEAQAEVDRAIANGGLTPCERAANKGSSI